MRVTTDIPCGSGRILKAGPDGIEVELIAYAKEARYVHLLIADSAEDRRVPVVLRPDRHFFQKRFLHFHQHVWVREGREGCWRALPENAVEKTPEAVRFQLDLRKGRECWVSTEPPREYAETNRELFALARRRPEETRLYCIGHSIEERPILLLRVTDPANQSEVGEEPKPVIHIVCGEHGIEFAGEEIGRGMLDFVLAESSAAQRRDFVFDFILTCNPDGNVHGWHNYNARDWLEHNYADRVDRSWHHEFSPYLSGLKVGTPFPASPETRALMGWMRQTAPALYLSLHSWHGHGGRPGAYHAGGPALAPEFREKIAAINEGAIAAADSAGTSFLARENGCDGLHVGDYLMEHGVCLSYLPEGHMNLGRERLQRLGAEMLRRWLADERLSLRTHRRELWRKIA